MALVFETHLPDDKKSQLESGVQPAQVNLNVKVSDWPGAITGKVLFNVVLGATQIAPPTLELQLPLLPLLDLPS